MISSRTPASARALLNNPRAPADAQNPAASDSSSVSNNTSIVRNASPPVTPPVSTGSMITGRNAISAHTQAIPAAPKLPSSTSSAFTRVKYNSPSVPSRRSRLMLSTIKKPAQQLSIKAAMTMLVKTEYPRERWPPGIMPDIVAIGRQKTSPASATAKRVQYSARLRARERSSRSMSGRIITFSLNHGNQSATRNPQSPRAAPMINEI